MNKEEFWKTIESVNHSVPDGNHEMVAKQMCEELLHYSPQDILDWHLILREYTNAAYRNDLWAACTALGAHSSDDGFIDFRTWLISQGKDIYMDAMRDPDTLAANPHAGNEMNFEAFSACAIDAYERKLNLTGMDRYTKPYDSLPDFPSINDGQIRCQAGPSVQKTACGKLYRNDSARDNDTSVQSQPPPKWGSSNEGGRQRSCRG